MTEFWGIKTIKKEREKHRIRSKRLGEVCRKWSLRQLERLFLEPARHSSSAESVNISGV